MGRDKALVEFRGLPMLEHVAGALRESGLDVLVVGREETPSNIEAIPDVPGLGGGPAIGLLSAFRHVDDNDLFLAAVDQPLLQPNTVRRLLALSGTAVVPHAGGHPQVTCALYRRECHEPLEQALASGQMKLRQLLTEVDATVVEEPEWSTWNEDGRSWLSLDTPRAVRGAETLL
jgi:molybdopterin-guanine dinucleotide biosynthesis protein A